jgi:gluconolactonase
VCNDGGLGFTTIDGIRQPFELAADNKGGSIQRVDLATGAVETVYTHCGDTPILSGNDIVFDTDGGFYFNDTVAGVVYYGQPDGSSIHVAATGVQIPNGLGLSPDQTRLYASETYTGRIVFWDVTGVGTLSDSFVELYSTEGRHDWDGLAIDSEGNVCAADLQESGCHRHLPRGACGREGDRSRTRPVRHQHLLRGSRYADRLHHLIGAGPALPHRMALPRTPAQLQRLTDLRSGRGRAARPAPAAW